MQRFRNPALPDLVTVWLMLLVQALVNDAWLYSPVGGIDAWVYVGYGLNYGDPAFYDGYYKISRLPWILLEAAARSTLDGMVASWVLQLGMLALGATALYLLFARTLGRMPAFVGAAFFVAFPLSHATGGADYHNALAGPMFAIAWWLVVRGAQETGATKTMFWAGAAGVVALHSNITFVSLAPILVVHYVVAGWLAHGGRPPIVKPAARALLGAGAATLLLANVNVAVGREYLFFMPQFELARSMIGDSSKQATWWNGWGSGWAMEPGSRYLAPLAAGLVAAIAILAWVRMGRSSGAITANAAFLAAANLYAGAFWLVWQSLGQTALQPDYFAYPLVFPLAGVVAASAACWAPPLPEGGRGLAARGAIAALLLAPSWMGTLVPATTRLVPAFLLGCAALAVILWLGRTGAGSLAAVALLGLGLAFGASPAILANLAHNPCPSARWGAAAVEGAHRYLRSFDRPHAQVLVWGDSGEMVPITGDACAARNAAVNLGYFDASLAGSGFPYLQTPWDAPGVEDLRGDALAPLAGQSLLVVLLSADDARVARFEQRFLENGVLLQPVDRRDIEAGGLTVPVRVYAPVPAQ